MRKMGKKAKLIAPCCVIAYEIRQDGRGRLKDAHRKGARENHSDEFVV